MNTVNDVYNILFIDLVCSTSVHFNKLTDLVFTYWAW